MSKRCNLRLGKKDSWMEIRLWQRMCKGTNITMLCGPAKDNFFWLHQCMMLITKFLITSNLISQREVSGLPKMTGWTEIVLSISSTIPPWLPSLVRGPTTTASPQISWVLQSHWLQIVINIFHWTLIFLMKDEKLQKGRKSQLSMLCWTNALSTLVLLLTKVDAF